ncbi:MAG: hypothetical protein J7K53_10000 [Bacteroidales bacterium]|nr:hypothetical protein [Bacteroidales bacterium]
MNERKQKIVTYAGMWLAAIAGSIYGIIFAIVGYLINWNHCGALEGPFWKVMVIGILSTLIGAYIGELVVRKRAQKIFADRLKIQAPTSKLFVIVFLGCIVAFVGSWEAGYVFGKLLGIFHELNWGEILIDVPLISLIHAIPISLVISIFYSVFVFTYLKVGEK